MTVVTRAFLSPLKSTSHLTNGNLTVDGAQALVDSLTSSTVCAAYSMTRKLVISYSGYAFQVRRTADNTTLDIGFSGNVVDTAALLSFCIGSNDGYVTKIYDQTANAQHLLQSNTSYQPQVVAAGALYNPINSLPTAVAGKMAAAFSFGAGSQNINLITTTNLFSVAYAYARLAGFTATGQSADYNNPYSFIAYVANASSNSGGGADVNSAFLSTVPTIAYNSPYVYACRFDGTNNTVYYNLTAETPVSCSYTFGATGTLCLHSDSMNSGNNWYGATSEMIIATAMTTGDLSTAQNSMRTRYGTP